MFPWLLRKFGIRAATAAVHGRNGGAPLLDVGLGFSLLRDGRVPLKKKATALLLGLGALMLLNVLELPVEILIAVMLNAPGLGLGILYNAAQIVVGPVLFGSLFLVRLADPGLVASLRAERSTAAPVPPPRRVGRTLRQM
jgi:hypothetical protein